jgi:hypothetical protein
MTQAQNVAVESSQINSSGVLQPAGGGTGVTTTTGSGSAVLNTSPTLVTPALGTPSAVVLTNATSVPVNQATGQLPVANGGTGATATTGSGNNVLSTSPTLVTPVLGTPTSGTLTNCTGLPVGGISATGTPSSTTYLRGDSTWATVTSNPGTVTSVSGTGTVSGITLSGTVTSSGNLTLGGTLAVATSNLPAGTIKQVVQVTKQDVFTTTSTSFVDITGMSATITPTSASSKILVMTSINLGGTNGTYHCYVILLRNGSTLTGANGSGGQGGGGSAPNGGLCMLHKNINDNRDMDCAVMNYLDSPGTTSALTYKLQMAVQLNTFYVNRGGNADVWNPSGLSTITLMEVAA